MRDGLEVVRLGGVIGYHERATTMSTLKILGIIAGILLVIGLVTGHSSTSSSDAAAVASAHVVMLHGRRSDNSCIERDNEARIYVMFTLRNTGDKAATVNPWATFDYSDGGNSTESYNTNYGHYLTVPAHTEVDATFYHTFNPQQHYMIRCAGYPDLSTDTAGFYLPMHL
jgi:hypothetical protein